MMDARRLVAERMVGTVLAAVVGELWLASNKIALYAIVVVPKRVSNLSGLD